MIQKKKGVTLIELIIFMSLLVIVLDCSFRVFLYCYKNYKINIKISSHRANLDEMWIFLENNLKNNNTYAEVYGNHLFLKEYDINLRIHANNYKFIRLKGNKLVIEDFQGNSLTNTGIIARDISSFQVERKDNLILIKIISEKGVVTSRCIENMNIESIKEI